MALWNKISSRGNVEDRRSSVPLVVGGMSLTGAAIYLLINLLLGGDLGSVLEQLPGGVPRTGVSTPNMLEREDFEGNDTYENFAATVLGSNNEIWSQVFEDNDMEYTEPKLVLFREATDSACGVASSKVGPHYCPMDQTIYLDETFFEELNARFGAQGGDVAQAYVIAHEVGHHVQSEIGTLYSKSVTTDTDKKTSAIKLELQADCYAGMWANSIKDLGILEPNEISEAMDAAASVGDDRIQERVTGYVDPERWTHGSSAQRVEWFTRGYETGELSMCDTFKS